MAELVLVKGVFNQQHLAFASHMRERRGLIVFADHVGGRDFRLEFGRQRIHRRPLKLMIEGENILPGLERNFLT